MMHYIEQLSRYREKIDSVEVSLAKIKAVLYAYFDIKDEPSGSLDEQIRQSKFPTVGTITKEEKDAWIKSGMPNIQKFLKQYRAKKT